jgi:uncharacterized membrane protein YgdD (TMEM256/DUF423 family)
LLVALGIASGAFAAHAIVDPVAADWMRTAGLYMMIHGVAVIVLADGRYRLATHLMYSGACLFAMTLCAMAAGAPRWLGAVTPIGGVLMIAGWVCVAWTEARRR